MISPPLPERLLIRAPNWLGDAVMALPAVRAVRAALPNARIAVGAVAAVAPIFEEHTGAAQDDIVVVSAATEVASLAGASFDAALLLTNSFRTAWAARQAGIGDRWGYRGNMRGLLLTRPVGRPSGPVHQSAYYADLVRGLGIPVSETVPRMSVRPETFIRAQAFLLRHGVSVEAPVVGFAPGAAYGHAKRWPPKRVAEVIARLAGSSGATCMLVGAAGDRAAAREIELALPSGVRVVDFVGRTDLRLLVGLLAVCDAFVSNDSGAMHLAAALGVPVTAIFGPTDEHATAPDGNDVLVHDVFCRPCMLRECPIDHRCMKGITVDAVFESVSRRLDSKGTRGSA